MGRRPRLNVVLRSRITGFAGRERRTTGARTSPACANRHQPRGVSHLFRGSPSSPGYFESNGSVKLGVCPRKTLFVIMLTTSEHRGRQCHANRTIAQCALCTSLVSENTQTHS